MAAMVAEPVCCNFDMRLEGVFAESSSHVVQWRKERSQALQLEVQRAARELCAERAALQDLYADLANTAQLKEAALKLQEEGALCEEATKLSAETAAERSKAALQARDRLCQAHEACRQELKQENMELAKQIQAIAEQESEVEKFLAMYKHHLGLSIERIAPQTVRLTFTLIDEADPEREFSFALGLADSRAYLASECRPQVPQLKGLLARLNAETGAPTSLPALVCGMRRAFQEAARNEASA